MNKELKLIQKLKRKLRGVRPKLFPALTRTPRLGIKVKLAK